MTVQDTSPRAMLLDMAQGYMRGKILCAAVRLGIADALSYGAKHLDDLAARAESNPDSLRRFLRALASIGIVEEVGPDRFALTPLGQPLRSDAPGSAWASVVFWADLLADSWTYLAECVRAGGRSAAMAEMERAGVKSRWSQVRDALAIFHAVFAEPTAADKAPLAATYDFSGCRVVADLGGAGGGLLAAILSANLQARGILVDRKEAIDNGAPQLAAAGLAARSTLVAGDLLESVPRGADAYVLSSVLHGYGDDDARRILQNCRTAMAPESRLVVIEVVLPAKVEHPDPVIERLFLADLNMLAVTGGRERSETEWQALLSSAGFEVRQIIPVPVQTSCIIEAAVAVRL
jgi:hypothetical protein